MKRFISIFCIIFIIAGASAFAKDYVASKKTADYTVTITIDRNPPIKGVNNIQAGISDAKNKPVTDAVVAFEYSMPAMSGMPAMNYKAPAKLEGGVYRAAIDLSMAGPWTITAKITRGGKTQSAKITVDVR